MVFHGKVEVAGAVAFEIGKFTAHQYILKENIFFKSLLNPLCELAHRDPDQL